MGWGQRIGGFGSGSLFNFQQISSKINGQNNISSSLINSVCRKCWISTTSAYHARKTKQERQDQYYEDKLPIFEYNKMNDRKKRMYVFGDATHGAIGLESLIKPQDPSTQKVFHFSWKPVRHKFAEFHEITGIAAGHGFTLIAIKPRVNNGPMVFGCGSNHFSQLGYQAFREGGPMEIMLSVVPMPFPGLRTSRVLALGAGRGHSLISIDGEGLYTLGDNSTGQCGREVIPNEQYMGSKYIHRFSRFLEDPVVLICSRFDLSLCVTKSGKVYTFGDNHKGQLGRGKGIPRPWQAHSVEGDLKDEKVIKITTSGSSVLALTDKGELFGWGCNECGQSDPNEMSTISYHPKHVKLPRDIGKVVDVAMGDYFSFILNEQGQVYVWGQGQSLGLGPKALRVRTPTLIPPPLFGQNEFYSDVQVTSISASFMYAAAVNSKGDLFTWGKDIKGCLGLGEIKYQPFPLRVGMGACAKRAYLGIDHTVVIGQGAL